VKTVSFHLDFISPYAYLAFEALPQVLAGIDAEVLYRPILFAGVLKHHGQLGPAEIAPKRDWTYRQVLWQARQHSITLDMPKHHPFNPLGLLRLSLACGRDPSGTVSRNLCARLFRHVWVGGEAADDAGRLRVLTADLAPVRSPGSPEVKSALRDNTDAAIAHGVFGVPAFEVDGLIFWGFDSLPMLRAYLLGDPFFNGPWQLAAAVGEGVVRSS
jgi:2-hydroxychromene-2-carboxylate isomerase